DELARVEIPPVAVDLDPARLTGRCVDADCVEGCRLASLAGGQGAGLYEDCRMSMGFVAHRRVAGVPEMKMPGEHQIDPAIRDGVHRKLRPSHQVARTVVLREIERVVRDQYSGGANGRTIKVVPDPGNLAHVDPPALPDQSPRGVQSERSDLTIDVVGL